MAISSTDISNLISGQIGSFTQSQHYAQAVSAQHGFSPGGGGQSQDPRSTGMTAAGLGAGTVSAAQGIGSALTLAAGVNMAPAMIDPFSAVFKGGFAGFRAGGVGAAIGGGLAAMAPAAAVWGGVNWMAGHATTGAQTQGAMLHSLQGAMPGRSMESYGMMANQIRGMANEGMGNIADITGLLQGGLQSGSLNTNSLSSFTSSFRTLVNNVREVATTLNSSMQEAQQALELVKGLGISSNSANSVLQLARGVGQGANIDPSQMMSSLREGAMGARALGIDPETGARGAMITAGVFGVAHKTGVTSTLGTDPSRYTQGAMRFLMSSQGRKVLGAMMDSQGGLDTQAASLIASGMMSKADIAAAYARNVDDSGDRDRLVARGGELAGQFISQFGPQGAFPALNSMTEGMSRPETMQRMLTGLNRVEIQDLNNLAMSTGGITNRIRTLASDGFRRGRQKGSVMSQIGTQVDQMLKPLTDKFEQFGADMTQAYAEAMQEVTNSFVSAPPPEADPDLYLMRMRAKLTGNARLSGFITPQGVGTAPVSGSMLNSHRMSPATGMGSFANYLPSGLRMGVMPEGTSLSELPMFGFGQSQYNNIGGVPTPVSYTHLTLPTKA